MGAAGFHQLGSAYADARIARVREKLARGETVYLAGIGPPGTHNSGVALVEVTLANGPRLIVNNEEERFSGNKHTTEYPRASIDAMVATLRRIGRDIGDISAWLTGWDYPELAGTIARSVLEEVPQSLKLLRTTEAAGFDGRRLDQMTRTPKILGRQLGLSERVPLIDDTQRSVTQSGGHQGFGISMRLPAELTHELCERLRLKHGISIKGPALWHQLDKWKLTFKKNPARQRARAQRRAAKP